MVNDNFVPVWVNVRQQPVPDFPARAEVLLGTRLDETQHVENLLSQGFFLRSLVLAPEDLRLLNPQAATVAASASTFSQRGYFAYAQTAKDDYVPMLTRALEAYRATPP
mgnify:CR=1 FL=1